MYSKSWAMRSNYKPIGDYIQLVDIRNKELAVETLLGLTINKLFIPSVANTVGTNMKNYKIIRKNQFACSTMQVRRDGKMPVALLKEYDEAIISQAYPVFEVKDESVLIPEYLMMWFSRSEFDREACFHAVGGVRGSLDWEDFCNMQFPLPSPEIQREIVKEYNTIKNRIALNNQLIQKLEETAQAIYKQWFVDFEFPDENGKPYKSSGGKMVWNEELEKEIPEGWENGIISDIAEIIMGQSPKGDSYNTDKKGVPLVNGPVEFGDYFAVKSKWTTSPTKHSEIGDLIICVRGSTVGKYVKSDDNYCLGRGVCVFRAKKFQCFTDLTYKSNYNTLLSYTTGSTFPNWDRQTLSEYKIVLPTETCAGSFENFIESVFIAIENKSRENTFLIEFKDILLSKVATIEN